MRVSAIITQMISAVAAVSSPFNISSMRPMPRFSGLNTSISPINETSMEFVSNFAYDMLPRWDTMENNTEISSPSQQAELKTQSKRSINENHKHHQGHHHLRRRPKKSNRNIQSIAQPIQSNETSSLRQQNGMPCFSSQNNTQKQVRIRRNSPCSIIGNFVESIPQKIEDLAPHTKLEKFRESVYDAIYRSFAQDGPHSRTHLQLKWTVRTLTRQISELFSSSESEALNHFKKMLVDGEMLVEGDISIGGGEILVMDKVKSHFSLLEACTENISNINLSSEGKLDILEYIGEKAETLYNKSLSGNKGERLERNTRAYESARAYNSLVTDLVERKIQILKNDRFAYDTRVNNLLIDSADIDQLKNSFQFTLDQAVEYHNFKNPGEPEFIQKAAEQEIEKIPSSWPDKEKLDSLKNLVDTAKNLASKHKQPYILTAVLRAAVKKIPSLSADEGLSIFKHFVRMDLKVAKNPSFRWITVGTPYYGKGYYYHLYQPWAVEWLRINPNIALKGLEYYWKKNPIPELQNLSERPLHVPQFGMRDPRISMLKSVRGARDGRVHVTIDNYNELIGITGDGFSLEKKYFTFLDDAKAKIEPSINEDTLKNQVSILGYEENGLTREVAKNILSDDAIDWYNYLIESKDEFGNNLRIDVWENLNSKIENLKKGRLSGDELEKAKDEIIDSFVRDNASKGYFDGILISDELLKVETLERARVITAREIIKKCLQPSCKNLIKEYPPGTDEYAFISDTFTRAFFKETSKIGLDWFARNIKKFKFDMPSQFTLASEDGLTTIVDVEINPLGEKELVYTKDIKIITEEPITHREFKHIMEKKYVGDTVVFSLKTIIDKILLNEGKLLNEEILEAFNKTIGLAKRLDDYFISINANDGATLVKECASRISDFREEIRMDIFQDIFEYTQENFSLPNKYRREILEMLRTKIKDLPEGRGKELDEVLEHKIIKLKSKYKRSVSDKNPVGKVGRQSEIEKWTEDLGNILIRLSKNWEPVFDKNVVFERHKNLEA